MNNRQKRLCRLLLDFYDESGAQPCPLAHLAKKTGHHISDIYDKDSQSGDLWPFDPKARGNYAGMLSFASGKKPTATITPAGLVALEKLCRDDTPKEDPATEMASAPIEEKTSPPPRRLVAISPPKAVETPEPEPIVAAPPKNTISPDTRFSVEEIDESRVRFTSWLKSEEALKTVLGRLDGNELIEAAFDKFFSEFLKGKES